MMTVFFPSHMPSCHKLARSQMAGGLHWFSKIARELKGCGSICESETGTVPKGARLRSQVRIAVEWGRPSPGEWSEQYGGDRDQGSVQQREKSGTGKAAMVARTSTCLAILPVLFFFFFLGPGGMLGLGYANGPKQSIKAWCGRWRDEGLPK
ncbi:hypothetical protein LZ31DRAFT_317551 [Colletotrichum somersetense]|nr:hypothetical protein LZ31DRAFT_317551 [Colletotrichum somersetense]